jgi:group I intron endonuclease
MRKVSGIYGIRSISHPERIYIGSAMNIRGRWGAHLSNLNKKRHHSIKLQHHYDKYGVGDLVFEIILQCNSDVLLSFEQAFIDLYSPWFNICPKASSRLGVRASAETREKCSAWQRGRKLPEETVEKMRIAGKNISEETRAKLSRASRGHKRGLGRRPSSDTREKMGQSHRGNKNMLGKHHSPDTRERMSETHKGMRHSAETIEKMRESAKRRWTGIKEK